MTRLSLTCLAACAILTSDLVRTAEAQPIDGVYVDLGAGASFFQDQIVRYGQYNPGNRSFKFDTGGAGQAAVGYGFGNGLRVEIEGDYADSSLNGVRFANGFPGKGKGTEPRYGGFANVLYDFNVGFPVTPYLGAGAGYQEVELDKVATGGFGVTLNPSRNTSLGGFAYQGIAGVGYEIAGVTGLSLTLEYRFIGVVSTGPYDRGLLAGAVTDTGGPATVYARLHNTLDHQVLLGVRYAFGAPIAATPVVASPAPAAPPAPAPVRTYLVFFDWDRADLTARARQIVAEAAQAASHVQTTRIEVNGYTDLSGTAAYNQSLSVRRAQSVQAELVRDGVNPNEISIHGLGESDPLVPTGQGVREPQNRRVEIMLR